MSSPDALYVFGKQVNFQARTLIAGLAADKKLPSIYEERLFVEAGGLMSYFIDLFQGGAKRRPSNSHRSRGAGDQHDSTL